MRKEVMMESFAKSHTMTMPKEPPTKAYEFADSSSQHTWERHHRCSCTIGSTHHSRLELVVNEVPQTVLLEQFVRAEEGRKVP